MLALLITLLACIPTSSHGAQISLQFTRATHSNAWKIPSFVKGGRTIPKQQHPTQTISSLLLQVRGGSDNRGDPPGGYYRDDEYSSRRRPEYEEKRIDDYYCEQDGRSYYEEDRRYEEYDDRGRGGRSRPYDRPDDDSPGFPSGSMPSIIKHGDRKIGMALLALGAFFTISGVALFFHKTLLRLGNLLFIAGVPLTIGPGRTAGYFFQPRKARATGFLAFGIFLVFFGWPILGMALEIFGLMNLFGNMIPMAMVVLRQMPIVGGFIPKGNRRRDNRNNDDRYYNDDQYRDDRYYGDDDNGGGDPGDRYY